MAERSGGWRGLARRVRARVSAGSPTRLELADVGRRLARIEAQLETVHKVWLRTRHLESSIQSLIRERYLDPAALPYPERLTAQRFRLLSQNQEDGLTLALLREAGSESRRFVEIGSGQSGGNSGFLARELGWRGLMVDGRAGMEQVARRFPGVTAVSAWITRENINTVIEGNGFGGEVDVFSLDLDGNDYWIWEAMTACRPRIAILEYNSMYGPDRAVTVPYDPQFTRDRYPLGIYFGASLQALARLGARKGYRLVAVEPTGVNAFFLRSDLAPHVPTCEPERAYRLLEKHDVLLARGEDVFAYAARQGLPLVEVS